jgi:uncharacterized protein (DUF488 family)
MRLFTIGYEGTDLADFLATLKRNEVDLLLDVREIPLSRRKGFSKSVLREALAGKGIEYRHEKRLGSPKVIRHRLYADGNYERFFRDFWKHLAQQEDLLEQLAEELSGNVALMCYERDPATCHRSAVVEALGKLVGLKARHLGVKTHEQRKAPKAAHPDLSQSLSAA